jgi:voltage-gated potassium channel
MVSIAVRFGVALLIIVANWGLVVLESGSYTDSHDGHVSVVDALYYTTVTLTTTGYGDITPITAGARLVNALVVTPLRLLFVVLLVGTTIKALTQQSRQEFRLARWRKRMRDHVIVLGYGTKGRNAARALLLKGTPADHIVVIDRDSAVVAAAVQDGHGAVIGSAANAETLRRAMLDKARVVIVALDRDDTSVLATLTVRRAARHVQIITAVREAPTADLVRQGGADSVIVSSETTGRLLGLASYGPQTVEVVEDLLSFGAGLDLVQRPVRADEVGLGPTELAVPVLAVLRGGQVLRYNHPDAAPLRPDDDLICAAAA